jgi:predicted ribosomally synthesized peptide with nif11-like leader
MSRRDALAFLEKIAGDRGLRARVKAASIQDTLAIAKETGFDVTIEELKEVGKEIKGTSHELSDEMLGVVIGGVSTQDIERWFHEHLDTLRTVYDDIF